MDEKPAVVHSEQIFKGRVFGVRSDTIEQDGKRYRLDIVEHPGSFAIAAMPSPQTLILVRQYRHAAGKFMWEVPAGSAHENEPCEEGARRELREETGYTADRFEMLYRLYPTPGFCNESVSLFTAAGLHPGPQQLDEDERIEVREFTFEQLRSMQASGEIDDMKTAFAVLYLAPGKPTRNKSSISSWKSR